MPTRVFLGWQGLHSSCCGMIFSAKGLRAMLTCMFRAVLTRMFLGRQGLHSSCCGMIFSTKGFSEAADGQRAKLEASLVKASQGGRIPIVCDTSPCLAQLKSGLTDSQLRCAPPGPPSLLSSSHLGVSPHDQSLGLAPHRAGVCQP